MPASGARSASRSGGANPARWRPWLLVGPAYLWLLLAVFLPLSAMAYFSLLDGSPAIAGGTSASWTLANYLSFFRRPLYPTLLWRSVTLGLTVTAICALIGLFAGVALARALPQRARTAVFLLILLPFWTSGLVRVFSWVIVLRPGGILDRVIAAVIPGAPHLGLLYTNAATVIGLVHAYLPYTIITCYLATLGIDEALFEAARSLGCSWPAVFRRITLPLAVPGLASGAALTFVPVVGSFMEPRLLGGRSGTIFGTVIEDQFTAVFNWPLGAALSFVMLAVVLLIMAAATPVLRNRRETAF
jgi:spermidine/putrescine transport system permease protein